MKFLKKYIKKYKNPFFLAVACLIFEAICDLMQPTIMSKIIDIGVKGKNLNYVFKMGGIMLFVTTLGALAAVSRNIVSSNVSQKFGAELRGDLFKKIQGFSFENIDKFETSSLMTRLTNDVTQVQNFVHGMMRIFVKAPILCVGSLIMTVLLNPRLALILIAVVPIIAILIFSNMKIGFPFFNRVQRTIDKLNGVMREYLSGIRVVKAFNRFDFEINRFEKANDELATASIRAMRAMAIFSPGITLTVNVGIVAVIWFGGFQANSGDVKVGQIIAFINYMTQILFSLMMISFVFTMLVRARASAERIGEVFNEENCMKTINTQKSSTDIKGKIDFKNVTFSYASSGGEPILKGIDFSCLPGEIVGIIGSTGSGKSSIVNLISRFYDTSFGEVRVDDINVKDQDLNYLRKKIAMVPQKAILFTGTIMENIMWGKEKATYDEVMEASKAAQAHDFIISFPEQYNTLLGQGGVNLSGGQKQRISIARALIKKPEILILDDSTSAVDMATEAKIREALKETCKGLTCLIIAQRITSVMDADKILVIDNGEIAGIGTHLELMLNCNIYQDIYKSQIGVDINL